MPDVLLVDPDAKARAIAAWGLARDGFDVVAAASGDEALRRAEDSPPRLVLADLDLGDVDGIGLLTELRRRESTRSVPFFFVASGDVAALRERGYRAGAQDVFARPLFVRDLCTLARLHGGRPAQETAASGDLADVRLHFLLRLLVSGGRTGRLRLSPSDAAFAFRSGRIVDAAYGRLRGEAAVLRAAILAEGPFRVEYVAVEERDPMAFTTRDVVHRLFPRVRRWDELRAALPPLWSVLETDFKSLGGQVEAMPPPVRALTRLFDGRRDLRTVVLESDLDDLVAIEVVARLDALGILRRPQGLAPALPRRGQTSSASTGPPDSSRRSSPGLPVPAGAEPVRPQEGPAARLFEPEPRAAMRELSELFPSDAAQVEAMAAKLAFPAPVDDWAKELDLLRTDFRAVTGENPTGGWAEVPVRNVALDEPVERPAPRPSEDLDEPASPLGPSEFGAGRATVAPSPAEMETDFFDGRTLGNVEGEVAAAQARLRRIAIGISAGAVALIGVLVALPRPAPPPPPPAPAAPSGPTPAERAIAEEQAQLAAQAELEEAAALATEGKDLYTRGRAREALDPLGRALELAPDDAAARLLYALALYDAEQPGGAEEQAKKVLAADERNARALFLLGAIAQESGRNTEARDYYQRFLKIAPPGDEATEVRRLLNALR